MSETKRTTTKKKSTVSKAKAAPAPALTRYLITGRYPYPPIGSVHLPKGMVLWGFLSVEVTEAAPGQGVTHSKAMESLRASGAGIDGIEIHSVSTLPENW